MLRHAVAAVIDMLDAIPPVRYVMGLVDARWRPLWAALWLAAIASIFFLTIKRFALRHARQSTLQMNAAPERNSVTLANSGEHEHGHGKPEEKSRVLKPASPPPRSPSAPPPSAPVTPGGTGVPVSVIAAAVVAGVVAVVVTALLLPNKPGAPTKPAASAPVDTPAAADTGLDVRWRSGRMDRGDCLGTFEVTRGDSKSAKFVAFVMDTSGAIMARDSVDVLSARPGLLVDFRFRRVRCDRIYDWQLQVMTPKAPAN